jgi:hypothetical protein
MDDLIKITIDNEEIISAYGENIIDRIFTEMVFNEEGDYVMEPGDYLPNDIVMAALDKLKEYWLYRNRENLQ